MAIECREEDVDEARLGLCMVNFRYVNLTFPVG